MEDKRTADEKAYDDNMNRQMASNLYAAKNLVTGDRQRDYGTPRENFARIANLWEAYTGYEFTTTQVAMMLGLLKVARAATAEPTLDTFRDLMGYVAIACAFEHPGAPLDEEYKRALGVKMPTIAERLENANLVEQAKATLAEQLAGVPKYGAVKRNIKEETLSSPVKDADLKTSPERRIQEACEVPANKAEQQKAEGPLRTNECYGANPNA